MRLSKKNLARFILRRCYIAEVLHDKMYPSIESEYDEGYHNGYKAGMMAVLAALKDDFYKSNSELRKFFKQVDEENEEHFRKIREKES